MKKLKTSLNLSVKDTIVVNCEGNKLLIVSFLEALYDDDENFLQAKQGVSKCRSLIKKNKIEEPINILVDLRPMRDKGHISPKAKNVYMRFVASDG